MWEKVFKSQTYDQPTYKHIDLPIYQTKEFDFYRCVEFQDCFYGITTSELFNGNLRYSSGRYSSLFPNQKISYWSNSPKTALAEIRKHYRGKDYLLFWAYDDCSSFSPCLGNDEMLIIVDGRKCGIQDLIDKIDNRQEITKEEKEMMKNILDFPIDCIAYDSKVCKDGENFIFLERGFKKLFLRELKLKLNSKKTMNRIVCSVTSDYSPCLESYGCFFLPICKVKMNNSYLESEEYLNRKENIHKYFNQMKNKI